MNDPSEPNAVSYVGNLGFGFINCITFEGKDGENGPVITGEDLSLYAEVVSRPTSKEQYKAMIDNPKK